MLKIKVFNKVYLVPQDVVFSMKTMDVSETDIAKALKSHVAKENPANDTLLYEVVVDGIKVVVEVDHENSLILGIS